MICADQHDAVGLQVIERGEDSSRTAGGSNDIKAAMFENFSWILILKNGRDGASLDAVSGLAFI
jgi:hypothetical protein